jgi:hypothetical protein
VFLFYRNSLDLQVPFLSKFLSSLVLGELQYKMPSYLFWNLLIEIACDTPPAEVEFKLKSTMAQKITDSRNEFNDLVSTNMMRTCLRS